MFESPLIHQYIREQYEDGRGIEELRLAHHFSRQRILQMIEGSGGRIRTQSESARLCHSRDLNLCPVGSVWGRLRVLENVTDRYAGPVKSTMKRLGSEGRVRVLCDPENGGCGRTKVVRIANLRMGQTKSCGCLAVELSRIRNKARPKLWRPYRAITKSDGYVIMSVPPDERYRHSLPTNKGNKGTMLEHRYIMENHLGRKLERWEEVDHINTRRWDNRIENLRLRQKGVRHPQVYEIHKAGSDVESIIAGAVSDLSRLAPELLSHEYRVYSLPVDDAEWAVGRYRPQGE